MRQVLNDSAKLGSVSSMSRAGAYKTTGTDQRNGISQIEEEDELQRADTNMTPNRQKLKKRKSDLISNSGAASAQGQVKAPTQKSAEKGEVTANKEKKRPEVAKTTVRSVHGSDKKNELSYLRITQAAYQRQATEEDWEPIILQSLRLYKLFSLQDSKTPGQSQQLKPSVAIAFQKICNSNEENVPDTPDKDKAKETQKGDKNLKNFKVGRRNLQTYLKKRYNLRLASKMSAIFDWSVQVDYDAFYNRVSDILLRPKAEGGDHLKTLKRFAFQLFDMNSDQMICETDIFAFMKHLPKDPFFQSVLVHDLRDLLKAFNSRKADLLAQDEVFDMANQNEPRIKDLHKYLA